MHHKAVHKLEHDSKPRFFSKQQKTHPTPKNPTLPLNKHTRRIEADHAQRGLSQKKKKKKKKSKKIKKKKKKINT